jgi:CubicO group peptidase (beta-lactamase class C family)
MALDERRSSSDELGGTAAEPRVEGEVAPGFEAVREAFADNLRARGELGAAFAVTLDGQPVVDLWGGLADGERGRPWQADTLQVIFSGTKGLIALCLLMLADREALDLDAPVARYWPQFAANGKGAIRVSEVASHQAGLPALREPVTTDEILDGGRMAELLAAQPVEPDRRAVYAYHPLTFGWLCGELIRRVDGRAAGRFFAEEVAAPLGLEIWIGLPPRLEGRVSRLAQSPDWGSRVDEAAVARDDLLDRIRNNPPLFAAGAIPWNAPAWHAAEIPGAGGIATARSLARLYGCLARGGELDGVRLLRRQTLERGRELLSRRWDPLGDAEQAYGLGFELQTAARPLGPAPDAFGHRGAGGSVHCAWPSLRLGASYAMNLMRDDHVVDPRAAALLEAVHRAATRLAGRA